MPSVACVCQSMFECNINMAAIEYSDDRFQLTDSLGDPLLPDILQLYEIYILKAIRQYHCITNGHLVLSLRFHYRDTIINGNKVV